MLPFLLSLRFRWARFLWPLVVQNAGHASQRFDGVHMNIEPLVSRGSSLVYIKKYLKAEHEFENNTMLLKVFAKAQTRKLEMKKTHVFVKSAGISIDAEGEWVMCSSFAAAGRLNRCDHAPILQIAAAA